MFPQSISKARRQAFTLVEITLALGIVAFAVIVSFGLVSTATQSFHDTRRDTVYANILQYASANANLTPFASLGGNSTDDPQSPQNGQQTTLDGKLWKFDMEGLPLPDSTAPADVVYYAKVVVSNPPILPAQGTSSTRTKSVIAVISDSGIKIPDSIKSPVSGPEDITNKIPQGLKSHIVPYYVLVGDLGK